VSQFTAELTVRHGFPFKPLSMAYDPIQHLLAIGTRCGEVRIFGRPGLDMEIRHDSECQILQVSKL
jgi:syntaxin-binding protein 5